MSTLKVDTITDTSGNSIPYMKGAVLQVQYFQLTTTQEETYSSLNTDQVVTNFNVTITPKSSSSIIKLEANIMYESVNTAWNTMWFFFRNDTKLGATGSTGNRTTGISSGIESYANDDGSTPEHAFITYFDTPNTTSAITYKLGVLSSEGTSSYFINRTVTDNDATGNERGVSFISATEIGG